MRLSKPFKLVLVSASALVSVGFAQEVYAQAAPAQANAEGGVEALIVTARRQEETAQSIPVTVTALGTKTLEKLQVQSLRDLNNLAPGLNMQVGNPRGGAGRLNIRGLSGGTTGGAKASLFLDGIYQTGDITAIPIGSLARVEVLPGPQSAQFGRATFGGAINYVTKDPTERFAADGSVEIASFNQNIFNTNVSGPITDTLGFTANAYVSSNRGDKDWRSAPDALHPNGVRLGQQLTRSVAGKLVWRPTDTLKVSGRVGYTWNHDSPPVTVLVNPTGRNRRIVKPNGTVAYYWQGTVPNYGYEGPDAGGSFEKLTDPGRHNLGWRSTLIAEWDVAGHTVMGSASYGWENTKSQSDSEFTYFPGSNSIGKSTHDDSQFELRILSNQEKPIRYAVGGYYLNDRSEGPIGSVANGYGTYNSFTCTTLCVLQPNGTIGGTKTTVNTFTPSAGNLSETRNRSVFGSLFWDVTEQITASVEARYQVEDIKSYDALRKLNAKPVLQKSFLPRFNVQYKFSPDLQAYVVYSIGQSPGGTNTSQFIGQAGTDTTDADRTFDGDKLYNYEFGIKGSWFNRKLVGNLALYHMEWKDMITSATYYVPGTSTNFAVRKNRGSSNIDGFGLELNAAPGGGFDIRTTLSYNRSKYKDFCSPNYTALFGVASGAAGTTKALCFDVNGSIIENTPPLSGSASIGYTRNLFGDWDGTARLTYQYQDGQYESDANLAKSKAGNVFNLSAGIQKPGRTLTFFCRNCSNDKSPLRFTILSDPRTSNNNGYGNRTVGGTPRLARQLGATLAFSY